MKPSSDARPPEPIEVRHRWRERLCRLLNHGTYEERTETGRGNVLVGTLVLRECGQGHLWQRRFDLNLVDEA